MSTKVHPSVGASPADGNTELLSSINLQESFKDSERAGTDKLEDFAVLKVSKTNDVATSLAEKEQKIPGLLRFKSTPRTRLKSMLRAGLMSNRLNPKNGKIRVVHDHSHAHDKFMFHPLSRYKQIWDIMTSIYVLWLCGKVPVTLGFDYWYYKGDAIWIKHFDIFLDVYFWVDMAFMFNSGFVHDGHVVMNRKASAKHYFEFWFWIDITAQMPWEYIMMGVTLILGVDPASAKLFRKTVKLVKFFKLAKLLRLGVLLRILRQYGKYYKTVLIMLVFFLSLHLGACILVGVADPCGALDGPVYTGLCAQSHIPVLYAEAMHLSLVMLLGNSIEYIPSEITAHVWDNQELVSDLDVLATLYMLSGLCLFGVVVAFVTNIIIHSDENSWSFHTHLASVKAEVSRLHLPKKLAYRVMRHYDYMWAQRRHHDHHFLREVFMSGHLKRDILLHHYKPFFDSSRLYARTISDEVVFNMAQNLNLEIYLPDERLFTIGEMADRCYLIVKGRVKLYLSDSIVPESSPSVTLGSKQLLGEYEVVDQGAYMRTAITATVCELMALSRLHFVDAIRGHDLMLNKLKEKVKQRRSMHLSPKHRRSKPRDMFWSVRNGLNKKNIRMRKISRQLEQINKALSTRGMPEPRASINIVSERTFLF